MLKRVEQKRHHNFKVTNHLPGYGNIQNKILESVEEETVVKEVIGDILDSASLVNFQAKKKKRDEVINEIKILANESKIRLGPYRIDGRKVPFQDRTIERSPDYEWCEEHYRWEWL